ncbi:MAG TPA: hypothetical protein VI410_04565 [Anaerolineales bacterium]|mgnify:CR=1 FL=1|nr:hypothetical protein [Anaerolineales bacterium]
MRMRVIRATGLLLVCSVVAACAFEPSLTPIDWGSAPAAPDFELDPRARDVQEAIDEGDYQRAIDLAIQLYNIDVTAVSGVPAYDPNTAGAETRIDGTVVIGRGVFSSPGLLATVIAHEAFHAQQLADNRWFLEHEEQGFYMNEVEAYAWNLAHAQEFNLTEEEIADLQARYDTYYAVLLPEYQELADQGIYDLPPLDAP